MYNEIKQKRRRLQYINTSYMEGLLGGFIMSQTERDYRVEHLLDNHKFNEKEIVSMSDEQIEYFHWLYFEESVYDLM